MRAKRAKILRQLAVDLAISTGQPARWHVVYKNLKRAWPKRRAPGKTSQ